MFFDLRMSLLLSFTIHFYIFGISRKSSLGDRSSGKLIADLVSMTLRREKRYGHGNYDTSRISNRSARL